MDNLTLRREVLEKIRLQMSQTFPDFEVLAKGVHSGPFIDQLCVAMKTDILGQKKEKVYETSFTYPSSWWQQFKQRFFPNFLLKRYPVKTETETRRITVNAQALFPNLRSVNNFHEIVYRSEEEAGNMWKMVNTSTKPCFPEDRIEKRF